MGKRYKNKRAACGLCKPHKRGWADRRSVQTRRHDAALRQELRHGC